MLLNQQGIENFGRPHLFSFKHRKSRKLRSRAKTCLHFDHRFQMFNTYLCLTAPDLERSFTWIPTTTSRKFSMAFPILSTCQVPRWEFTNTAWISRRLRTPTSLWQNYCQFRYEQT